MGHDAGHGSRLRRSGAGCRAVPHDSARGNPVRSWYDECLGHAIPDPARWGTAWLHGLSLTLPAGTEPQLVVDDQTIDTVTLDRHPNTGATILTVIDADERSNLIPGLIAVASGESRRLRVADGSLRNVTHWGFRVSGAVRGTRLALETASGALFDVQIGGPSDCCVWVVTEGDSRYRAVWLSLDSGAAGRRPTGHVSALVLHQPAGAPMLLLSGAWLARPRSGWHRHPSRAKGMPARGSADPA